MRSSALLVAPESPVDTLASLLQSDLNFHEAKGAYCAHAWHPFPAKFPPQLPEFFIGCLTAPNDVVLDPMMGSGTTLLEASRLGRRAIGCDIDPLSLMVAEAKLSPVNFGRMIQVGYNVLNVAESNYKSNKKALKRQLSLRFDEETLKFVNYWFLPETQMELMALIQEIEKIRPANVRRFFLMIFSSIIIAKSAGVSMARDLAHTRPHRVADKIPVSAFPLFLKRLSHALKSGENSGLRNDSMLKQAAAQKTGLPEGVADLIVTSPPYANNAIDYMRAHKFSLVWMKHAIKDLSALRARYLGHDAVNKRDASAELPRQCEETLNVLTKISATKAAALRWYFCEMRQVINEMRRTLKREKSCIIVVASSILCGIDVETHKGLAAIGEMEGFDLSGIGMRRIDRNRRMMPTRKNAPPLTKIEQRMHDEYIIGLVKAS